MLLAVYPTVLAHSVAGKRGVPFWGTAKVRSISRVYRRYLAEELAEAELTGMMTVLITQMVMVDMK